MMSRRDSLSGLVCLGLLVGLTGCIPESQHPLSDPQQAVQDAGLHGVWTLTSPNGDVQYLHIAAEPPKEGSMAPEPGAMRSWLITHSAKNRQVSNPFGASFFTSQVGNGTYANVLMPFETDPERATKPKTYWLIQYRVDGNALEVTSCDLQGVAALIDSGLLHGSVVREAAQIKAVTLSDSTAELGRYLREQGSDKFFPEKNKTVYQRLR
jgi:hypothetical protein